MAMRIGTHLTLWQQRWHEDVGPHVDRAAAAGADGVEVSIPTLHGLDVRALRRRIETAGLGVTCTTSLLDDTDITSDDPVIRRAGIERLRHDVELTAEMGSRVLCGVLYAAWSRVFFADPHRARQWSVDALRQAGEIAARAGVTLGLEALNRYETSFLNTAAQARGLADEVGLDNVGVHLDSFHMNMEENDMPGAIATAGTRLVHVHCADGDRGAPGRSHIPWPRLVTALREVGYDGWLVMECGTAPGTEIGTSFSIWREFGDGDAVARAGVSFLRSLLAGTP